METNSEPKPKLAELPKIVEILAEPRKIANRLAEAANALAGLAGHEEAWSLEEATEEVVRPSVVTLSEPEVGFIEEEQLVPEAAYREDGPNGQLAPLAEPISKSSAGLVVEQTVESSLPDIRQTPNGASPSAVLPMPRQMERRTEPSDQEIRLRAYFLSERRRSFALPGAIEDVALSVTVASAKPRVESIEQEKGMPYETTSTEIQSSAAEAIPEPASNYPNAVSAERVFPQTTTLPTKPNTTQIQTAPVDKSPFAVMAKTPRTGPAGTSVDVTFSFEITAVQLTPTFEMDALTVRPASRLVMMRLALHLQSQPTKNLQVSFEAAKIQPVGGTLGTLRMLPFKQQRPVANGSHSSAPAGLQVVPNFEAAQVQLTPSEPAQATVFVTVPCEISIVEFSPLFEIASVILNSSCKRVFVQLPGTSPGGEETARVFEIANLELTESGDISTMQLNLLGPAEASVT